MKRIVVHIVLVFLLITIVSSCARKQTNFYTFQPKHHSALRIATYNVNWGKDSGKNTLTYEQQISTIKTIRALNADIVVLQETTPSWKKVINQKLATQFRYRQFRPYPNAGGLGILSKYPFTTEKYLSPVKDGWHPAWIVSVHTSHGQLQLANVHLTPQLYKSRKIGFFGSAIFATKKIRVEEIKKIYAALDPNRATIIAGDFNSSEDAIGALHYLRLQGFSDALDHVKRSHYTWRYRLGKFIDLAKRFDRIFYSPNIYLINAQVLHEGCSDHYPVVADFMQ